MRLVLAFMSIAVLCVSTAEETTTESSYDNINSIDTTPSIRLDPYIRKALLKALSELEESDTFSINTDSSDGSPSTVTEILRTSDVSPTAAPKDIRIHSFVVNGQSAFSNINNNNTKPTILDKKISILSTSAGNVENYSTATFPTQASANEIFYERQAETNFQHVRSIQTSAKFSVDTSNPNTVTSEEPKPTFNPTSTTTTTTTTTTPKPTHNIDGENIENVDRRDIQVFQAPLVAAFTVQQDETGSPKNVIPIYQQTNNQGTGKSQIRTNLSEGAITPQVIKQNLLTPTVSKNNNFASPDYITQQLTLQKQLEEKQRLLEEQLQLLKIQQQQQEELLRKQQFYLQQKEAQRQQQILLEQENLKRQQYLAEQQRLQALQNNNIHNLFNLQNANQPISQTQFQQNPQIQFQHTPQDRFQQASQAQFQQTPQAQFRPSPQVQFQQSQQIAYQQNLQNGFQPSNLSPPIPVQEIPEVGFQQSPQATSVNQQVQSNQQVIIQPSVPLAQTSTVGNQQQLPNREAVDFLLHLRNQQPEQFPLQQNHLPQGISGFLQPNQNIQQDNILRSKGNRVFRQETGVGNLGLNTNQNYFRFNTFSPVYTNRHAFGNRPDQFNSDAELKQLLAQSGLSGRNQEDLNIVSKVLSLNHGISFDNNILSNRLPFDSRRHVKPFA